MNATMNRDITEKEVFIEKMEQRTKQFAVDVIKFCDSLNLILSLDHYLINP